MWCVCYFFIELFDFVFLAGGIYCVRVCWGGVGVLYLAVLMKRPNILKQFDQARLS